jgi:hypothetical protein
VEGPSADLWLKLVEQAPITGSRDHDSLEDLKMPYER